MRKEADHEIKTMSVDAWKREISQAKIGNTQNKEVQSQSFQEIKTNYDQARMEWGRQREAIDTIESQLRSENSKLTRYKDCEKQIGDIEARLGELSRFNPFNRNEIKDLEHRKKKTTENKQTEFGEATQKHIEQRITQLNKEKQSKENKMPELNTRHRQTKDAFDQRDTELKALKRQKNLNNSKDLLERYKGGEKISDKDKQLINSFSKELGIKKIQARSQDLGRQR